MRSATRPPADGGPGFAGLRSSLGDAKVGTNRAEEGRNGVRQVRRDANDKLKKLLKDSTISEDDERRSLDEVQKITDQHVAMIDDLQKKKDAELLNK